jgi:hypothetical protein
LIFLLTASRSVALTVNTMVPTGKLSGMVALYHALVKIGEWSFASKISTTKNVSVVLFGFPSTNDE